MKVSVVSVGCGGGFLVAYTVARLSQLELAVGEQEEDSRQRPGRPTLYISTTEHSMGTLLQNYCDFEQCYCAYEQGASSNNNPVDDLGRTPGDATKGLASVVFLDNRILMALIHNTKPLSTKKTTMAVNKQLQGRNDVASGSRLDPCRNKCIVVVWPFISRRGLYARVVVQQEFPHRVIVLLYLLGNGVLGSKDI